MTAAVSIKRDNRFSIVNSRSPVIIVVGGQGPRGVAGTVPVITTYTDADIVTGTITIDALDDRALIDVTGAVNIAVPAAATRGAKDLLIKDIGGTAGSGNLTPVFHGGELCDGLAGTAMPIASAYGSLLIAPLPTNDGYYRVG